MALRKCKSENAFCNKKYWQHRRTQFYNIPHFTIHSKFAMVAMAWLTVFLKKKTFFYKYVQNELNFKRRG